MLGPEDVTNALVNEMPGVSGDLESKFGVIPRAIYSLFELAERRGGDLVEFTVKCSYIEIYNESVNDLLSDTPNTNLRIREFPRLGMCVIGMTEKHTTSPEEIFECLASGTRKRITAATGQNSRSSRSHTLFSLVAEQKMLNGSLKASKLNLVDLAGSEKVSKTGVTGKQLKEAQNINLSLTTLGRCINALASSKETHVPFRESKLTMILRESLGGNAKTALICTASLKQVHVDEAEGTLKFAERAKKVTIKAKTNLRQSPEEMATIIEQLKLEVTSLRAQLRQKNESGPSFEPVADEIYIQYAELKAQYESLNETSQIEIERLRGKVEQLTEQCGSESYAESLQEHLDRMEEANEQIEALSKENESLRERMEEEVQNAWNRTEAVERTNLLQCTELQKLANELSVARQEIASLQMHIKEQNVKVEAGLEAEKSLVTVKAQLNTAIEEQLSLNDQVTQLHSQLVDTRGKLTNALHREEALQCKLQLHTNELTAAQLSLSEANKVIADLQNALKGLNQDLPNTHQEAMDQVDEHLRNLESPTTRLDTTSSEEGYTGHSPNKKHGRAKSVVTKLITELTQLKTAYETTQISFSLEVAQIRNSYEERSHGLEQQLVDSQEALQKALETNTDLEKALKLAGIELESTQFHLKLVKAELVSVRSLLAEERQARENQEPEARKLREEQAGKEDPEKKQLYEAQETYKALVASHQEALHRQAEEISNLRQALHRKDTELRDLSHLERSVEAQLSKAVLRIQKLERQVKQPITPRPRDRRRSVLLPMQQQTAFNRQAIQALYSIDSSDALDMEDVCPLPDE